MDDSDRYHSFRMELTSSQIRLDRTITSVATKNDYVNVSVSPGLGASFRSIRLSTDVADGSDTHFQTVFSTMQSGTDNAESDASNLLYTPLCFLLLAAVFGNTMVILSVIVEKKLRVMATNHFIASLALSDLLVGATVMPFAVYLKINNNKWQLGHGWCRFHLSTTVFATTASIINLVAISIDRYFAIIFPTEYQRHSIRTRALPYIVLVWIISGAVSAPIYLEQTTLLHDMCWLEDPQYMIMSSLLSFFLPACIISFLYVKIFRRIRKHLLLFWAGRPKKTAMNVICLPQVIVEEVRSRKNSRVDTSSPSRSNSPTKSISQPDMISYIAAPPPRNRSPTIGGSTLPPPLNLLIQVPDPPTRRESMESSPYLTVNRSSTPLLLPKKESQDEESIQLEVPSSPRAIQTPNHQLYPSNRLSLLKDLCRSNSGISSQGTASSVTSQSSDERKSSMYSYGSSLDDDYEFDRGNASASSSRKGSTLERIHEDNGEKLNRKTSSLMQSGGNKLRRIAQQVTKAIRRKRRESQAIRRETRATRVVATILIVFILCWLPYFCSTVYRGTCSGLQNSCTVNYSLEIQVYLVTSWLGYAHSCFNCVIYTFLNKTFRATFKRLLCLNRFTFRWNK